MKNGCEQVLQTTVPGAHFADGHHFSLIICKIPTVFFENLIFYDEGGSYKKS